MAFKEAEKTELEIDALASGDESEDVEVDADHDEEEEEGADDQSEEDKAKAKAKAEAAKKAAEINRENARRRREKEAAEALDKRELETVKRLTGGTNPFTGLPIEDKADMEQFYAMKDIEKSGGDPLKDYAKYQKEHRKAKKETESDEETTKAVEERNRKDWQSFKAAYPDVTREALKADSKFLKFAKGKIGVQPLAEIYADYRELVPQTDSEEAKRAAALEAKRQASVGSLGKGAGAGKFFTREQVAAMSVKEVQENIEVIRKSKPLWK